MATIDHLVYAVPDLADGVTWFEAETGIRPALGGTHPGRGTHNALVSLGRSYLELIAPDPGQPDHEGPRPFGIALDMAPTLVTFAARPDAECDETIESLVEAARQAGHDPGDIETMTRSTPDGTELRWRLTLADATPDGFVPFLIDWGETPHPTTTAPSGVQLVGLTGSTPRHADVNRINDALDLDVRVTDGTTGLAATLKTVNGSLTLSGT